MCIAVLGCAASQPTLGPMVAGGPLPGFWRGFWHGIIAPISFIVSLLSSDVRIYAFPNDGRWYDFGFMLGISGFSGGLFAGSRGYRPRDR
jgi:hypothetical protein